MIPTNGKIRFKPGDIVFFKKQPTGYTNQFKIGKPYRIKSINDRLGMITGKIIDIEGKCDISLHNKIYLNLISARDWNLNQLI